MCLNSSSLMDLFGDEPEGVIKELSRRLIFHRDPNVKSNNYVTAHFRNICSVDRESDATFLIRTQFLDDDGMPLINIMNQCPRVRQKFFVRITV